MSALRQVLLTLVLVAVAGGGWWAWNEYRPADPANAVGGPRGGGATTVIAAPAEARTLIERTEAVGTTRARQAIEIVPLDDGRLVELMFQPGDLVAAGQVLARLDADIQRADLDEARASLREKELALERARTLRATAAVPQASIDQLVAERAAAQARVDRGERRLADREISAPFEGVVGLRRVDVGARVTETTVLTTLDDLAEIEIAFQLPERLFARVRPGQVVTARAAAFGDEGFTGTITSIDSRIDATARSFQVRAVLPNADYALPAGMFVHLEVVLQERPAVVVPEGAVVVEGDAVYLYVVEDDRAVRRDVRLGQRELGVVEIRAGLDEGEVVISQGVTRIRDGVPVRVRAPEAETPSAAPVAIGGNGGAPA
ncbi:MAG: efflux RND transporter periplasmic adaptor subunit [Geminicoccaceae bacterium]|nr:MAG: efflux RND transporter periplasmic adaptor subunit [Geminicoccaceae bacterium]